MKTRFYGLLFLLAINLAMLAQVAPSSSDSQYVPVHVYDPARNAAQDIQNAQEEAKKTGKRVLMEVGGDWASWCHTMETFFVEHPDLMQLRDKNYVLVAVNFSKENQNREVLSRYPKIFEFPHLFVLDADGKVLQSQQTSLLEQGETYSPEKFKAFLLQWAPGKAEAGK